MTLPDKRPYLLCYDIANKRRLGRIYRFMLGQGMPVQYSVFLLRATPDEIQALISEVIEIIDEKKDDVRVYPLPHRPRLICMGEEVLPEDVRLFDEKGSSLW